MMTEKYLTENYIKEENSTNEKAKGEKLFQTISLAFLPLFWIGYFYSLYRADETNISSYTIGIIVLSLVNSNVLFKGEKTQCKVFDILAKAESILLVVLGVITIAGVLLK